MTKEELRQANSEIVTLPLKRWDKEKGEEVTTPYAPVNERVKAFRKVYPTGKLFTNMESFENGLCIFRAEVGYYDDDNYRVLATGTAYEQVSTNSFINKVSIIENCETSAVGRALGFAGFGIDTGIASKEEVERANELRENTVSKAEQDSFKELCEERGVDYVGILKECGWQRGMSVDKMMLDEASAKVKKMPHKKSKLEKVQSSNADPIEAFKKNEQKAAEPQVEVTEEPVVQEPVATQEPEEVQHTEPAPEEPIPEKEEFSCGDGLVHTTPTAGIAATKFDGKPITEVPLIKLKSFIDMPESFTPESLVEMKTYYDSLEVNE